jgi:hypothetical protein
MDLPIGNGTVVDCAIAFENGGSTGDFAGQVLRGPLAAA